MRNHQLYRLCGPTTLHLKYELTLLVSLTLLTAASLGVLYENRLDVKLIAFTILWQSRYLIIRLICTTKNFNTFGIRSMVCKLCVAGQYFDATRPSLDYARPQLLAVQIPFFSKFFASDIGVGDNLLGSGSGSKGLKKKDDQSQMKNLKLDKYMRRNAFNYVVSKYNEYVPPSLLSTQLCITIVAVVFLLYVMLENVSFYPYRRAILSQAYPLSNYSRENYGAIQTLIDSFEFNYSNVSVKWFFYFLVSVSTLSSVFIFGRLIPPIPDLVAGTNVIKAVRNEAKHLGKNSSKSKKDDERLCVEQYRSIVFENRLRLTCHVILFRTIENIIFVALLPVTELTCIISEICKPGPRLWERIDSQGIGIKEDPSMFSFIQKHYTLSLFITLITVVVTLALLISQTITLDKTYLALLSQCNDIDYIESSRRNVNSNKKVRKNETGSQSKVDHFENGVFEHYKQKLNELLSEEIGPPSSSSIVEMTIRIIIMFLYISFATCILGFYNDYKCFTLSMVSLAIVVAGQGITEFGLVRYNELNTISDEISQHLCQ